MGATAERRAARLYELSWHQHELRDSAEYHRQLSGLFGEGIKQVSCPLSRPIVSTP